MPLPLKALWYSPEKIWLLNPFVFISILRTFFSNSDVSIFIQLDDTSAWFRGETRARQSFSFIALSAVRARHF
jgi:hypothetical protein